MRAHHRFKSAKLSESTSIPEFYDRRSSEIGGVRLNQTSSFVATWIDQLTAMVVDRLAESYDAYVLTVMFRPLPTRGRDAIMRRALEQMYSAVVTRVHRDPNCAGALATPLVWIGLPDYIVPKRQKQRLVDVTINDGCHLHVIVLVPPHSRLRRPFEHFVPKNLHLFMGETVFRVHVEPFDRTYDRGVRYFAKSLTRRRISFDDVIFLPRSVHELNHPKWHPNHGRAGQVRRAPPL